MTEPKIIKVSQLNFLVKKILEGNFSSILVEGEISNLVIPASGHIYFSLKDESAQVRAVMFRQHGLALKFKPLDGMQVVVRAEVSLYEARGDYQLIIDKMEQSGLGDLHAKFLQLKEKLTKVGLFDLKHKKTLPKFPKTIGVITSRTGAVIRDILHVLHRRFPPIEVIIYPVMVQGSGAADQIITAIQAANARQECDLLILARGGGSLEDLWTFNEESVAYAIFESSLPIISAIGHETDFTIADFVADLRAPTPSVAAELAVPSMPELKNNLRSLIVHLIRIINHNLAKYQLLFNNLKTRLRHPQDYLNQKRQRIDELEHRLHLVIARIFSSYQERLAKHSQALHAISPLATLARGYSITTKDGAIIKSVLVTKKHDRLNVKLSDGDLVCLVDQIKTTGIVP